MNSACELRGTFQDNRNKMDAYIYNQKEAREISVTRNEKSGFGKFVTHKTEWKKRVTYITIF